MVPVQACCYLTLSSLFNTDGVPCLKNAQKSVYSDVLSLSKINRRLLWMLTTYDWCLSVHICLDGLDPYKIPVLYHNWLWLTFLVSRNAMEVKPWALTVNRLSSILLLFVAVNQTVSRFSAVETSIPLWRRSVTVLKFPEEWMKEIQVTVLWGCLLNLPLTVVAGLWYESGYTSDVLSVVLF